jgi:hypothetical protein
VAAEATWRGAKRVKELFIDGGGRGGRELPDVPGGGGYDIATLDLGRGCWVIRFEAVYVLASQTMPSQDLEIRTG